MKECTDENCEPAFNFYIETLEEILKNNKYTNYAFLFTLMGFILRYFECMGMLNKDFHFEVMNKMYERHPICIERFEEMITILSEYKNKTEELENR